jgi:riboflavin kinase/FMN adenylyltransferase
LLCSLEERIRLLGEAGASKILILPFTPELSLSSPERFVQQILVGALNVRAVFVGENFRFGHQQAGTPDVLKQLGTQYGFAVHFVPCFTLRGQTVSSSAIRRQMAEHRISLAGRMLGRCFSLEGTVVSGHGVGSKQTVPTLNLQPPSGQLIPQGVFVTETLDLANGRRWHSITNSGFRPTFGGEDLTVETFLLSPFEGPSPSNIKVFFRRFIRAERQFPDPASLKAQIMQDVGRAKTYWRRLPLPVHSRV